MELNSIISGLRFPVTKQLKDALFLLDEKGHILQEWNTEHFSRRSIIEAIREYSSFLEIFRFNGVQNLDELDFKNNIVVDYASQEPFHHHEFVNGFYTRKPAVRLVLNPAGEKRFLAALDLTQAYSSVLSNSTDGLIWLDQDKETVEGINDVLFLHLKPRYFRPYDLLGKPASEIMSPTPSGICERGLKERPCPPAQAFKRVLSIKELSEQKGLAWDNETDVFEFMALPGTFNPQTEDASFSVAFTVGKGAWPLVILGARPGPKVFPDAVGYTASARVEGNGFFIKRNGDTAADTSAGKETAAEGEMRLVKSGRNLHLFVNNRLALEYHDMDFIKTEKLQFWLGVRPHSALRFRALSAGVRPMEPWRLPESGHIVLKGASESYFTLTPARNYQLDSDRISLRSFNLHNVTSFEKEKRRILALVSNADKGEQTFLGQSPALAAVRENARLAAESGATLLIQGETGSGKEVLARFLHAHSPYAKGPFVKVDCTTLAPSLVESELFGHEKGAFTGATEARRGRFEEADKGVLFLDEISNLTPAVQAKLLGFLQDLTVTRVGGTAPIRLTLQIMAASNLPLSELTAQGRFREDLYYRLNVFAFTLPPLRDRLEDLPGLCEYFIRVFSEQHGKSARNVSGAAFRRLFEYGWPGNIRELKNALQRAVVFCDGSEIQEHHLSLAGPVVVVRKKSRKGALSAVTPEEVRALALELKGNVKKIAARFNVSRLSAYKLLARHGVSIRDFRKPASRSTVSE